MRKYRKGRRIKSLNELIKQENIYIYNKYNKTYQISNKGWWQNHQLRMLHSLIARNCIFKAVPNKWYKIKLKQECKIAKKERKKHDAELKQIKHEEKLFNKLNETQNRLQDNIYKIYEKKRKLKHINELNKMPF